MANWSNSNMQTLVVVIFSISYIIFGFNIQKKWGFTAHKNINKLAVFTIPNPNLFKFYKENIEYISEHAVDADKRRYSIDNEAPCHYIDVEFFSNNVDSIPKSWNEAIKKYSEDSLKKHGIAPWNIYLTKIKLQKAFENNNLEEILRYSADIGHYIGDIHVPLHTTNNYNGQLSNQHGIHGLWESRIIDLNLNKYKLFTSKALYINNIGTYIWKIIKESHIAVDSVLYYEKKVTEKHKIIKYTYETKGAVTQKIYSEEFTNAYHEELNGMVERRLRGSILSTGSIWYTAWVDAGQPNLNNLLNKKISENFKNQLIELDKEYSIGKSKGRICSH